MEQVLNQFQLNNIKVRLDNSKTFNIILIL